MSTNQPPASAGRNLAGDVILIVREAQQQARSRVNFIMIEAYWRIGKRIVEEEQQGEARAEYGKGLIKALARTLTAELGKGFSEANLWNFRQFFQCFPDDEKLYALRRELSWTHYRAIMRVENDKARDYYTEEAAANNWSTRQLKRNINTLYYERLLAAPDKRSALKDAVQMEQAGPADFVKYPYVLEFLGLPMPPGYSEAEFETAITEKDLIEELSVNRADKPFYEWMRNC